MGMKAQAKFTSHKATIDGIIDDAYSMLADLRDEVQEVVDNAPEGLQNSSRIETLSETASQLDGFVDSPPDVPENVQEIEVTYYCTNFGKKGPSRRDRRDEAVGMLNAVAEHLRGDSQYDTDTDVQELLEELDDACSTAEECEFPGMFG